MILNSPYTNLVTCISLQIYQNKVSPHIHNSEFDANDIQSNISPGNQAPTYEDVWPDEIKRWSILSSPVMDISANYNLYVNNIHTYVNRHKNSQRPSW